MLPRRRPRRSSQSPRVLRRSLAHRGQESRCRSWITARRALRRSPDRLAVAAEPSDISTLKRADSSAPARTPPHFSPATRTSSTFSPEIHSQHLLAHRCPDARPGLGKTRLVDIDSSPTVCERLRMFVQIRLHRIAVKLPENIVKSSSVTWDASFSGTVKGTTFASV